MSQATAELSEREWSLLACYAQSPGTADGSARTLYLLGYIAETDGREVGGPHTLFRITDAGVAALAARVGA